MQLELLKSFLNHETYKKHKDKFKLDTIPDKNIKALYNTIFEAHEKFKKDLTIDELRAFHHSQNPTLSQATLLNLESVYDAVKNIDISNVVADDLVQNKIKTDIYTEIAQLAIDEGEGKGKNLAKIQSLLELVKQDKLPEESNIVEVEGDLKALLALRQLEYRWQMPLTTLQEVIPGFGPGVFGLIAARPNAGKTAFVVSLIFQPGGFADQGAKVCLFGNEENASRTYLRGFSAYTGMTEEELMQPDNLEEAQRQISKIKNNVKINNVVRASLTELENYVKLNAMDILIIDQIDKVQTEGSFAGEVDRLKYLYTNVRELAKLYNIAIIGVCQASESAEGKLYWGMECLENSRTGKGAELDVCICIGKESFSAQNGEDSGFRTANIVKNKLNGIEKPVAYMLDAKLSRIRP